MIASVERLTSQAVQGDQDALGTLLERFGPEIERRLHVGARWRHALDAADIMQVTYLEAFLQIGRFDPSRGSFSRWLARIAANNLRDAIRGLRARDMARSEMPAIAGSPDESAVRLMDAVGVTTTTPSRVAGGHEAERLLRAAIDRLPPDYAEVVRRYDLDGQDIDAVATALGRSRGAVHMLRARAHDLLRGLLGSESAILGARA